eukprot:13704481-Alexandrium_andersonii.AAC.1
MPTHAPPSAAQDILHASCFALALGLATKTGGVSKVAATPLAVRERLEKLREEKKNDPKEKAKVWVAGIGKDVLELKECLQA